MNHNNNDSDTTLYRVWLSTDDHLDAFTSWKQDQQTPAKKARTGPLRGKSLIKDIDFF